MSSCCEDKQPASSQSTDQIDVTNSIDAVSNQTEEPKSSTGGNKSKNPWFAISIVLVAIFALTQLYDFQITPKSQSTSTTNTTGGATVANPSSIDIEGLYSEVIPEEGVVLPIRWGDIGRQMVEAGVIDDTKFRQLFTEGLTSEQEAMLSGEWDDEVVLTQENSRFLLDILWAFGLGNKNSILDTGEMTEEQYGGAGRFASTGGWSLAQGDSMDHYSAHPFVELTADQQVLVETVSQGIYRPCCGNSTHFPDCNHGMAMLGLLELMAANDASKEEMYRIALGVNSIWFPQTYLDLATYFKEQGQEWNDVDAATVLGQEYSSAQGYQATRAKIQSLPKPQSGGGGCGV